MDRQVKIMENQTTILDRQANENNIANKMQFVTFLRDHYQTVNKVLAEQQEARERFHLGIMEVISYMLISDYDTMYQMRTQNLIDDKEWNVLDHFIRDRMNDKELPIKKLWDAPGNSGRSPDFKEYVAACIYPKSGDLSRDEDEQLGKIQYHDCIDLAFR